MLSRYIGKFERLKGKGGILLIGSRKIYQGNGRHAPDDRQC